MLSSSVGITSCDFLRSLEWRIYREVGGGVKGNNKNINIANYEIIYMNYIRFLIF